MKLRNLTFLIPLVSGIAFFFLFAVVETTTIQGKIVLPDGTVATSGKIVAQLSTSGSTPDTTTAEDENVGGREIGSIGATGDVTMVLVPNDAITPTGTYYEVRISVKAPIRATWVEKWSITTSPDPIDIGAITRLEIAPGIVVGDFVKYVAVEPSGACTAADSPTWAEDTDRICECISSVWICGEITGEWTWIMAAASTDAISFRVTGDTQDRLTIDADGTLGWGSGAAATDITISRTSADHLAVDSGTLVVDDPAGDHTRIESESEKVGLNVSNVSPNASFYDLTTGSPTLMGIVTKFDPLGATLPSGATITTNYFRGLSGDNVFIAETAGGFKMRIHKQVPSGSSANATPLQLLLSTSTNSVQTWFAQAWVKVYNPNVETKDRVGFGADKTGNVVIPIAMESPLSVGEHPFYISDTTNDFLKYWIEYDAADEDWEVHDSGGCFAELPLTNVGNDVGQKGIWQTTCD